VAGLWWVLFWISVVVVAVVTAFLVAAARRRRAGLDREEDIDTRPEADGRWRWSYRRPADDVELHSNKSYVTAELAQQSALQAYPETPLSESS
jgi:hypothetical protein